MKLVRTLQSDEDVEGIADDIAQDSPQAASQWVDDIEQKLETIAFSPGIGRERPDIKKGLRTIAFGNYLICYRQISGAVEILRVFHGARLWQDLL